jgi:hypothetical protein
MRLTKIAAPYPLPIARIPVLTESVRSALNTATDSFSRTFAYGSAFHASSMLLDQFLVHSDHFDIDSFVILSACSGLQLATFPLLNATGRALFKPDLRKYQTWIPWTIGVATCSSVVDVTVRRIAANYLAAGRVSLSDWWKHAEPVYVVAESIGFHTAAGLATQLLPPPARFGGVVTRDTGVTMIGSFGAALGIDAVSTAIAGGIRLHELGSVIRHFRGRAVKAFLFHAIAYQVPGLPGIVHH